MYLLRLLSFVHVIDKSAFMAKTSSHGMAIGVDRKELNKDSLSCFVRVLISYCSCSAAEPLLTNSLTWPISLLLLFRVLEEATLDSTLGVVTLTRETGCEVNILIIFFQNQTECPMGIQPLVKVTNLLIYFSCRGHLAMKTAY